MKSKTIAPATLLAVFAGCLWTGAGCTEAALYHRDRSPAEQTIHGLSPVPRTARVASSSGRRLNRSASSLRVVWGSTSTTSSYLNVFLRGVGHSGI
mgnify:CR=1 FL=1